MPSKDILLALHTEISKRLDTKSLFKIKKLDKRHHQNFKIRVCGHEYNRKKRVANLRKNNSFWNFVLTFKDKKLNWFNISQNKNITMEIIEKYPDFPWDWNGVSNNPNLTVEFVLKNKEKNWNIYAFETVLCKHEIQQLWSHFNFSNALNFKPSAELLKKSMPYIKMFSPANLLNPVHYTIEEIVSNAELNWNWENVSKKATDKIVEENINLPWNWRILSAKLSMDFINKHKKNWCWQDSDNAIEKFEVLTNPNLTLDFISQNLDKHWIFRFVFVKKEKLYFTTDLENIDKMTSKLNIFNITNIYHELFHLECVDPQMTSAIHYSLLRILPLCLVDKYRQLYPNKKSLNNLANNPNLTTEFIENNSDLIWSWRYLEEITEGYKLLKISDLSEDFMLKKFDDDEFWMVMSRHAKIEFIEKYPNLAWSWSDISMNKNINIGFIKRNNKFWNWYQLSINTSITITDIVTNPHFPWSWDVVSRIHAEKHPEIIMQNPDLPWAWAEIGKKNLSFNYI